MNSSPGWRPAETGWSAGATGAGAWQRDGWGVFHDVTSIRDFFNDVHFNQRCLNDVTSIKGVLNGVHLAVALEQGCLLMKQRSSWW